MYSRSEALLERLFAYSRGAVYRWRLQQHPHLSVEEQMEAIGEVVVMAIATRELPRISGEGLRAFDNIILRMTPHEQTLMREQINRVRLELIGRSPMEPEGLPQALIESLGDRQARKVWELLRLYDWTPPRTRGGRKRTVDTKLSNCLRHGTTEHRLYSKGIRADGTKAKQWRCVRCLAEAKRRSALTDVTRADSLGA